MANFKVSMMSTCSHRLVFMVLIVFLPVAVQAHSGAVALARPLVDITVDGDLADWPANLETYPIAVALPLELPPDDTTDFEARFRVGYDSATNAVYVAVEVRDQSIVVDTSGVVRSTWNRLDTCELFARRSKPPLDGTAYQ